MKLLYLSPIGKKVELISRSSVEGHTIVDLDAVRKQIVPIISKAFQNDQIDEASEVFSNDVSSIGPASIQGYEVLVCDLSSAHATIMFGAGLGEALGKPVVYIVNSNSLVPGLFASRQTLVYSLPKISDEFLSELTTRIRLACENPAAYIRAASRKVATKAFISYSHSDRAYLQRLLVHLKPLERSGAIDAWVDTRLKAGDRWKEAIELALNSASIAILLISADFLASDFIVDNELPPLLAKAQVNGTRILPILVAPSRFLRETSLNVYQAVNLPSEPLSLMGHDEREVVYDKVAQEIESSFHSNRGADSHERAAT